MSHFGANKIRVNQPYIIYNDLPKLKALQKEFPSQYVP